MGRRERTGWTARGVVTAPVDQVWEQLLAGMPGLPAGASRAGTGERYRVVSGKAGEGKVAYEVDNRRHSVAAQGEWWYRGVHEVAAHPRGSMVTYTVYNIAPGVGWWAAQLVQGPGHARQMRAQLEQRLRAIAARAGGRAYLVD